MQSVSKTYQSRHPLLSTSKPAVRIMDSLESKDDSLEREGQMLDMVNRVQMFQIAAAKANNSLVAKNKQPVFNLNIA